MALEMDCTALCSELKFDCKVLRSVCLLCSVLISVSTSCIGRDAMETARCNTCWKELEKVLWPLNVIAELLELISHYLCKMGAEPRRVRPL
jgi:hypothetical protein